MTYIAANALRPSIAVPIWGRSFERVMRNLDGRGYADHATVEGLISYINTSRADIDAGERKTRLQVSRQLDNVREQNQHLGEKNWAQYIGLEENTRRAGGPARAKFMGPLPVVINGVEAVLVGVDHYDQPHELGRAEQSNVVMGVFGIDERAQHYAQFYGQFLHGGILGRRNGQHNNFNHYRTWQQVHGKPEQGIVFEGLFGLDDWTGHFVILPIELAERMKFGRDGTPDLSSQKMILIDNWYIDAYGLEFPAGFRDKFANYRGHEQNNEKLEDISSRLNVPAVAIVNTARTIYDRPDLVMAGSAKLESQTGVWSPERVRDTDPVRKLREGLKAIPPDDPSIKQSYEKWHEEQLGRLGQRWIRNSNGLSRASS